jgi:hypothetical protein
MSSQLTECKHNVVYAGVINLIRGFGIVGAVDAWTCTLCSELWCDEKRMEHQELPPEVGLPPRTQGADWVALVCDDGSKLDWNLLQLKKGQTFRHACKVFTNCNLNVTDEWTLECDTKHPGFHRLIRVRPNLNKSIYV